MFVSHVEFFGREGLYGDGKKAYKDNLWRFRLLSLATLEAPLALPLQGSRYGEDVMLVANDWQTAMVGCPGTASEHHAPSPILRPLSILLAALLYPQTLHARPRPSTPPVPSLLLPQPLP